MGTAEFYQTAHGPTALDAFTAAVQDNQRIHGHGGYTGTIAEKATFILITESREQLREKISNQLTSSCEMLRWMRRFNDDGPEVLDLRETIRELRLCHEGLKRGATGYDIANILMRLKDSRVSQKHGPAGCIDLTPRYKGEHRFLFFGLAPSAPSPVAGVAPDVHTLTGHFHSTE